MAAKVAGLRLFSDAEGKMNLGLADVDGAVLVVSQFTLYGDTERGRRPSFVEAARPELAIPLYERFLAQLRAAGLRGGGRRIRRGHAGRAPERRPRDPHPRALRMTPLVLASASPRRRQLLEMLGIPVEVRPSDVPEVRQPGEAPARLRPPPGPRQGPGGARATWCWRPTPSWCWTTSCWRSRRTRTTRCGCCCGCRGGRTRSITAVALRADETVFEAMDVTAVTFRPAREAMLRAYVAHRRADGQGRRLRHPGLRCGAGGADRRGFLRGDGAADPAGAGPAGGGGGAVRVSRQSRAEASRSARCSR